MFGAEASMPDVSIVTPHHPLNAYLSLPQGTGRQPGVVVIHDIASAAHPAFTIFRSLTIA
jgi:dienelactone hydrolase